ncbi:MAG: hypothetical protein LKE46_04735 [Clostridium sp.]|jgi:hypothetical protein|uniref:hypothetical protein n=1 Tax=Clostridium sp. TaxID=1506 RepID=UPI0025C3A0C4|nr:hypothetical protein [Clostridium sp.]MCH3963555.1 hypothetical protein [Clostridium sp.]MCI1714696.1 hypothetical protein [Clostridium sp.]MCI1799115.1 hypothetical protein [Clostridium sp.]MCI1812879.1 hypothetical protein [Clostridium sp.]MCI1869769.1 hypothetical protein [Clostridium sp.]
MIELQKLKRYGQVSKRLPREVILLRGSGCSWGNCIFCDYHMDQASSALRNHELNHKVLEKVTGKYGVLQVMNSGSASELDTVTVFELVRLCREKNIKQLIMESHVKYEDDIKLFREQFAPVELKFIVGAESFDIDYRENILKKGIGNRKVSDFDNFDWVNLLFGMEGQRIERLEEDVGLALKYFERVTINIFCENTTEVKRDNELVEKFYNSRLFKNLQDTYYNRVEVLDDIDERCNADLDGVGGKINE